MLSLIDTKLNLKKKAQRNAGLRFRVHTVLRLLNYLL